MSKRQTQQRHWFWRLVRWMGAIVLVWIAFCIALAVYIHEYGRVDRAESSDAIVVLGAGMGPSFYMRIRHGARLYNEGYADKVICTGAVPQGHAVAEAEYCRYYLQRFGVPYNAILLETNSRSTEENAMEVKKVMQAHDLETVLVVTQGYHIFRSHLLFSKYDIPHSLSPVPDDPYPRHRSIVREVMALHWQFFKDTLGLPFTHVP